MGYIYIDSHMEIRDGVMVKRCGWTVGDEILHPPFGHTLTRVAGPIDGYAAIQNWINTEGVKYSGGVGQGQGEWDCPNFH